MKLRFSKIAALVLVTILVASMAAPASAEVFSPQIYQTAATTTTNHTIEPTRTLTSTQLGSFCGGDVGIWFYIQNTGLQASFVATDDRIAYMYCYEDDATTADVIARQYKATFATVNGLYRPYYYYTEYINPNPIESDSQAELYMSFWIAAATGDLSNSVPKGIFWYRFWAY